MSLITSDITSEFNIEEIRKAGYDLASPVIICNTEDYVSIEKTDEKSVKVGETIMKLKK